MSIDKAVDVAVEVIGQKLGSGADELEYLRQLGTVALMDAEGLAVARRSYGDSWRKRGGVGAFMMLARKWDRLETLLEARVDKYDVIVAIEEECRDPESHGEAALDAVRDLRRYLLLVEAYVHGRMAMPLSRDNIAANSIAAVEPGRV